MSEHLFAADIVRRLPAMLADSTSNSEQLVYNLLIQHGLIQPPTGEPECDDWMQTFTGKRFYPLNPCVEDIDIEDIAHGLSNCSRFNGQSRVFYSVAQHSWLVSHLCEQAKFQGLMHDGTEAYLADLIRPVKKHMPAYKAAEDVLWRAIAQRFGLSVEMHPDVKWADQVALVTEKRDVMTPCEHKWILTDHYPVSKEYFIRPWEPALAKEMFLARFYELGGKSK